MLNNAKIRAILRKCYEQHRITGLERFFFLINFQQFIKNNNDNRNKNNHKKHVDLRKTQSHKHFTTSNTHTESKQVR